MYSIFSIINVEGLSEKVSLRILIDLILNSNLKPKDIVYAMRVLGVNITVEECLAYIEKESRDTL